MYGVSYIANEVYMYYCLSLVNYKSETVLLSRPIKSQRIFKSITSRFHDEDDGSNSIDDFHLYFRPTNWRNGSG